MNIETFDRFMDFCGYGPDDLKRKALHLVMVLGMSQRAAAAATGYSATQLNQVYSRVRREKARVEQLIEGPLL